jgi:hypothetical protein
VQANTNRTGNRLQGSLFQRRVILIGLLSQKRGDFIVVHATWKHSVNLGSSLCGSRVRHTLGTLTLP